MEGNIHVKVGGKIDTGKKWVDANGVARIIYRKTLAIGALPNNTTKNVAHGESINLTAVGGYADVIAAWASNGTILKTQNSTGVTVDINGTNVVVGTTADLSAYSGFVTIEFTLA
jgi:hypothetical protein